MKRYITKLILCLTVTGILNCTDVMAQLPLSTMQSLDGYVNRSGQYLMQIGDDETVEGSPFLKDSFVTGKVKLAGDWYTDVQLKYEAYSGFFQVKAEDQVYVISPSTSPADSIVYNDEVFVIRDMNPGKPLQPQYLALLYENDNYELAKKYRVRLKNAVPSDGYSEAQPAEFRYNPPTYYILRYDGPHEIRNKRTLADIFGVETRKVRQYMRKNNYRLKNEQDLVAIVEHFASTGN